jgi:uncharacterized OB-fold protein
VSDPVTTIESVVSLDYERPLTLATRQYLASIREGRIIGHRCPSCARIYTPPRGYCPICTVQTTEADEIELSSVGTLVSFSILNPDSLHQGEDAAVRGTVQLDGSDVTMTGELTDVTPEDAHAGIRLRAVFADPSALEGALAEWGGAGITGWERSGEPDVPPDEITRLSSGGAI